MQVGFIVILIIAIFVAIFAIQNGTPVPVDLFLARFEMPLAVVMMICIIIGAVLVLILGTTRQFKKRSESKEMKNKLKTLENDKVLADSNIKAMEEETNKLKENGSALEAKISELEQKNKAQADTIAKLNNELDSLKTESNESIVTDTKDEGAKITDNDEKSEAQS
ncbi:MULTISPECIES: LapA family protein [unclassified Sedimentibacter]|uniref:LapA family protein n=1 Tax=unclassified Sedimentibacter TaxID=2649220 RepID=UPI0027DEC043|nr:LapA family protein [Sedimentibacter sp. MB35-C1]WMJ75814.1 lipopolysaccharide assembly protein LapA domain-containing protein [Sedimentibacter sp. MB35-C1]